MSKPSIIHLETTISANIHLVYDLSRDLDLHMSSMSKTKERAIGGRLHGLIESGETVKWRGKHFGFNLTHTSLISSTNAPYFFEDIMIDGHFKTYAHQHHFKSLDDHTTLMIDHIVYETPYGLAGKIFDMMLLHRNLKKLITYRNESIQQKTTSHELQ